MSEVLEWLKDYSPGVVLLMALGAALVFVIKLIVEKSVESTFDARTKQLEKALERRSTFEEKLLSDRFSLIAAFASRLERVMTNLNRLRSGRAAPDGFMKQHEIVPLTEIFEDLNVHRLVLGEVFHGLFLNQAQLALRAANTSSDEGWKALAEEWIGVQEAIRREAEAAFGISGIKW